MKKIKYILLISLLITANSCKKDFYTNANVDPNTPPSASITPSSLLSSVEGSLGYTQGGTFDIFITLFDQQTIGIENQAQQYYEYIVSDQDIDDPWDNFYTSVFSTDKDLMTRADAAGYNAYSGVSRILMAYSLQINVDVWSNMPYSQALQGVKNFYPAYDQAQTLYTTIGNLVEAGITYLSDTSFGALTPGAEDIIYTASAPNAAWSKAVAAQWIKFGRAVEARLAIHQSKYLAGESATALTYVSESFASNADNAQYIFGTTPTSANPWNQFNAIRGGYIGYDSSTMASMLRARNDPRYGIYVDTGAGNESQLGVYYGSGNSPVEFICYDEMQFVAAEANLRNSNTGAAQTAFTNAITANMTKLGVPSASITAYLTTYGTLPANQAAALDSVAVQEYLALYLNPEAWTVWRRTGYPVLSPVNGNVNGVPRRFIYPLSEYSYNSANVTAQGAVTLWQPRIFWDVGD